MPDSFNELEGIVRHLDERFPDGNGIFQRVSRLAEETGELATAVNHREKMGVKQQKHGKPQDEALVGEVRDVLVSALAIAYHYGLVDDLKSIINTTYNRIQ